MKNHLSWPFKDSYQIKGNASDILAIPRDLKDIHKDGKIRGHYKKGIEKEY